MASRPVRTSVHEEGHADLHVTLLVTDVWSRWFYHCGTEAPDRQALTRGGHRHMHIRIIITTSSLPTLPAHHQHHQATRRLLAPESLLPQT